jgi:hypothetical protein
MNSNFFQGILWHETVHILISLLVALLIWRVFMDKKTAILAFLVGILLDVDHLFDYFSWFGFQDNFKNFFNVASYIHPSGKVYVPLHGWEWLPFFWLTGKFFNKKIKTKGLEWAILFSVLVHLIWDNFSFIHHPWAYSFFFRLFNNFDLRSFNGF